MKTMKKLLSLVLALILTVSCFGGVLAAEDAEFTVTYEMPEQTISRRTSHQKEEVGTGIETKQYDCCRFAGWTETRCTFMTVKDFQAGMEDGSIHLPGEMLKLSGDLTLYPIYANMDLLPYDVPHFEKYGIDANEGDYALIGRSSGSDGKPDPGSYLVIGKSLKSANLADIPDTVLFANGDFASPSWDIVFRIHKGGGPDGSRTIFDPVKQQFLCYDQEKAQLVWQYNPLDMTDFWNISVNKDDSVNIMNYELPALHLGYDSETNTLCIVDAGDYYPDHIPEEYKLFSYARREKGYIAAGYSTEVPMPCLWDRFTDCPDEWYHEAINYVLSNKLMGGDGDTTFSPKGSMTRAMVVTVLYRSAGEPMVSAPCSFSDVPQGQWYSDAIAWAESAKVVNGTGAGKFSPEGNITREDIATILWRYMGGQKVPNDLSAFRDVASIHPYALEAMEWANKTGLMKGDAGCLKPTTFATRAEFAIMMMRWQNGHYHETESRAG